MSSYLHHVPGRLRLQLPRLRDRRDACDAISADLGTIEGVVAAHANPRTGSIIIHYDRERLPCDRLWRALRVRRLVQGASPIAATGVTRASLGPGWQGASMPPVTRAVVGAVVDKLIERSAALLITALI